MSDTLSIIILVISIPAAIIMSWAIMQSMKAGAEAMRWKTVKERRMTLPEFRGWADMVTRKGVTPGERAIIEPIVGDMNGRVFRFTIQRLDVR